MNNCYKKKVRLSALLILIMTLLLSSGCAGGDKSKNTAESLTEVTESGSISASETEKMPVLPENADYNEYKFRVIARGMGKWICEDMFAESENGEPINDAVFRRNKIVEDKFNVRISQITIGDDAGLYRTVSSSIIAGDDAFDIMWVNSTNIAKLAMGKSLYDLSELKYLELSNPWWDQKAVENLAIKGHVYYTTGDISIIDNSATYVISFNKTLLEKYNLTDPYDLVRTGKWTVDKFSELCRAVSTDLNGDGIFNNYDLYGFLTYTCDTLGFMFGAGGMIAKFENDNIVPNVMNENVNLMLDKLMALKNTPSTYLFTDDNIATAMFV